MSTSMHVSKEGKAYLGAVITHFRLRALKHILHIACACEIKKERVRSNIQDMLSQGTRKECVLATGTHGWERAQSFIYNGYGDEKIKFFPPYFSNSFHQWYSLSRLPV